MPRTTQNFSRTLVQVLLALSQEDGRRLDMAPPDLPMGPPESGCDQGASEDQGPASRLAFSSGRTGWHMVGEPCGDIHGQCATLLGTHGSAAAAFTVPIISSGGLGICLRR